ncbi:hypothetical protein BGZ57DRAFT_264303 [Hyaloscypha finlandica]|nr:hypothetical protein BGZ57DRAFT_264303 [Hyaloscypha finlandica]
MQISWRFRRVTTWAKHDRDHDKKCDASSAFRVCTPQTSGIQLESQRHIALSARIPNNTHLYHRTHTPNAVKAVEWLAFEIEHAEMLARAFLGRRPGRKPGKPGDPERPERPGERGEGPPPPPFELTWAETVDGIQSMDDDDDEPDFSSTTRPICRRLVLALTRYLGEGVMEVDLEGFIGNMGMMVRCPIMVLAKSRRRGAGKDGIGRKEREKVDMEKRDRDGQT